jgi:hypothetical protein
MAHTRSGSCSTTILSLIRPSGRSQLHFALNWTRVKRKHRASHFENRKHEAFFVENVSLTIGRADFQCHWLVSATASSPSFEIQSRLALKKRAVSCERLLDFGAPATGVMVLPESRANRKLSAE